MAPLGSDLSLLLQLIVLVILIVGYESSRNERIKRHEHAMAVAVSLNAIGILVVMIPSFINYFFTPLAKLSSFGIFTTLAHAFMGSLAQFFGIAFVFNKKPGNVIAWMRFAIFLWTVNIALGFILYLQVANIL